MKKFSTVLVLLGLILGVHRGYLALWRDSDPEPWKVFPYKASTLPLDQQKRLEQGIFIRDSDQLQKLLGDYLS